MSTCHICFQSRQRQLSSMFLKCSQVVPFVSIYFSLRRKFFSIFLHNDRRDVAPHSVKSTVSASTVDFCRRGPEFKLTGSCSIMNRRILLSLKTNLVNGFRDGGLARQCSLVGDSMNDEERCDDLLVVTMRQDCRTLGGHGKRNEPEHRRQLEKKYSRQDYRESTAQ